MVPRQFRLLLVSLAAVAAFGASAQTPDTLAKLKASGIVTMGVRDSSGVLSYTLGNGEYVGYQIDICRKIIANVEAAIGRKLEVRHQLVTSQNRLPLVQNGTVDMECGSTTNSLARQGVVSFVNTTFAEPVRMLVKTNSGINSITDLNDKTVASITGGTAVQLIRKNKRANALKFNELYAKDHDESFMLLESGRADAWVMDNSLLAGLRARSKNPSDFKIVGESLSTEPIAIAIPKGDTAFKKIADDTVVQLSRSGEIARLYDKWFMKPTPPGNVIIDLPMSEEMKNLIANPNDKPVEAYAVKP